MIIKDSIQAVIFDLNGTILSDEDEYGLAFNRVLARLGIEAEDKYPHQTGVGVKKNWELFKRKYQLKTNKSVEALALETQQEYLNLIAKVTLKEGIIPFLKSLRRKGLKVALATSNNYSVVEKIFTRFDIRKYFDCITTAEEVRQSKPDPEIFLATLKKLKLKAKDCLVFEDSQAGIKAAHLAGIKVVGVITARKSKSSLKEADEVISSYNHLKNLV